jgi:hypothetical protein
MSDIPTPSIDYTECFFQEIGTTTEDGFIFHPHQAIKRRYISGGELG